MQSSVNLLPGSATTRFAGSEASPPGNAGSALSLLLAMVTVLVGQNSARQQAAQTTVQKNRASIPLAVLQKNRDLRERLRRARLHETQQVELRSIYSPLAILALLTEMKQDLDGNLEVENLEFMEQPLPTKNSNHHGHVVIGFKTTSALLSAQIVESLRGQGLFQDVRLQSPLETLNVDHDLRFSVRCTF